MKKKVSAFVLLFASIFLAGQVSAAGWKVDAYGNIKSGRSSVIVGEGNTFNCRVSISSTTASIVGDDGNALSNDNPCVIGMKSSTPGKTIPAVFSSAVSFTFGSSSDTDGNLWGIAEANWASVMPFFLGIITDGTNNYFTLSRVPINVSGATAAEICQKGDTDCDLQNDVMILTSGLTLSSWTSKTITQVGWLDATYATSGNAWTFALSAQNGFNDAYEGVYFLMPTAQNGAASGSYFAVASGTAPTYTLLNSYRYRIYKGGTVYVNVVLKNSSGGTAGSGTNVLKLFLPYKYLGASTDRYNGAAYMLNTGSISTYGIIEVDPSVADNAATFNYQSTIVTNSTFMRGVDQNNAARTLQGTVLYEVF